MDLVAVAMALAAFAILFGDNYENFRAMRPSVATYLRLTRHLVTLYGVGLGEAFASPTSSVSGGATPKPTSPVTAISTPEVSGSAPETPAL